MSRIQQNLWVIYNISGETRETLYNSQDEQLCTYVRKVKKKETCKWGERIDSLASAAHRHHACHQRGGTGRGPDEQRAQEAGDRFPALDRSADSKRSALRVGRRIRAPKIGCSRVHPISIIRLENIFTSLSAAAPMSCRFRRHCCLHAEVDARQGYAACMQVCARPCASSMSSSMHTKSKIAIVTQPSYILKGTHPTKRIYYHNKHPNISKKGNVSLKWLNN
jgi:hypothetical protein